MFHARCRSRCVNVVGYSPVPRSEGQQTLPVRQEIYWRRVSDYADIALHTYRTSGFPSSYRPSSTHSDENYGILAYLFLRSPGIYHPHNNLAHFQLK